MNHPVHLSGRLAAALLCASSITAHAAFFQLAENSPTGLGNAFAGGAAIAEDASAVWYNPAGLTRLSRAEYLVGGHIIVPSTEVKSVSGAAVTTAPIGGSTGGDAGESALIPNFYYARRLDERTVFGFGVNVPFGLATEYDPNWVGRYHAIRSEIQAINLNPGIGFKLNDQVSIGGGISYQMVDAELTQAIDFATICTVSSGGVFSGTCGAGAGFSPSSNATKNDGSAKVTADDKEWGFNLGLLWQAGQDTRLGLAYRSKMKLKLTGDFVITAPANVPGALLTVAGLVDSGAKADVDFPATLSLSAYHQVSPEWAIMGDVTRTYWNDLPELRIIFDSVQPDSVVTLDLKDVNRYSVGANYRPGGAWMYRFGVALDKTPTPNETVRTPRLPDEDRTWFAVGAEYQR
ncbi:MAG: outer membrane protein transport protein, partial [Gammaproteobacteria bacterium]|nr:outer membrane protein transport protein [Gammaproteobacteria bacterium]